ncbi:MAG: hypothetical protein DMG40_24060 [Acidobacteria bacterium]|nr:MAG: hypothetical protein DMG40_24060 [Acidobacteriota bacterium]
MCRNYEIFEVLPNGSPQRVAVASGLESAKLKLHDLASRSRNECYAADPRTRQIVVHMNVPPTKRQAVKRVFQISYDEQSGIQRAKLLMSYGYDAVSVISNEPAKFLLSGLLTGSERFDLFIIGHAAPEESRQEIAAWLKVKYPKAKVLALNPPDQQIFSADFNVRQDDPESWLPIVRHQLAKSADSPQPQ